MVWSFVANEVRKHCEFESRHPLQVFGHVVAGVADWSVAPGYAGSSPVMVAKFWVYSSTARAMRCLRKGCGFESR